MGWTSFDDFLNDVTVNGQTLAAEFYKVSTTSEAAGVWHSLWRVGHYPASGGDPAAGSGTPGAGGTAYTLADGSLAKWANDGSHDKHLLTFSAASTADCHLVLYDRLVGVSGISLASTGNKNVNSTALPRYSGTASVGVQVWLEVTTATATTAPIVSMNSYTDQDGNGSSAGGSLTFPATATNVDAFIGPLPLAAGDTGVRSVETINVATAGSAGVVNVVLMRPLAKIPLAGLLGNNLDLMSQLPSIPRLYDGHTLALAYLASASSAPSFWGSIRAGYG